MKNKSLRDKHGKIILSKKSGKYGAPLGRRDYRLDGKCYLQEVPLDKGGYDQGGVYWGIPDWKSGVYFLYVAMDKDGDKCFVRAFDRKSAKDKVKEVQLSAFGNEDFSFIR